MTMSALPGTELKVVREGFWFFRLLPPLKCRLVAALCATHFIVLQDFMTLNKRPDAVNLSHVPEQCGWMKGSLVALQLSGIKIRSGFVVHIFWEAISFRFYQLQLMEIAAYRECFSCEIENLLEISQMCSFSMTEHCMHRYERTRIVVRSHIDVSPTRRSEKNKDEKAKFYNVRINLIQRIWCYCPRLMLVS